MSIIEYQSSIKPFPVAISLSVLLHLGLLTLLVPVDYFQPHYWELSDVRLRLAKFTRTATSQNPPSQNKSRTNNRHSDLTSLPLTNFINTDSDTANTLFTSTSAAEMSSENSMEQDMPKHLGESSTSFDPAQFSFNSMPPMPLGATGKTGWGFGSFPETAERLSSESLSAQQVHLRISKQRKLVLNYLDKAQDELASRQPPTYCIIRFDAGWQRSSVKCEFAQDELMVNQLLAKGNVSNDSLALSNDGPCTKLGNKYPALEFNCP